MMRNVQFLILFMVFVSACKERRNVIEDLNTIRIPSQEIRTDLQPIFDTAKVIGSILIFDPQENIFYSNDFDRCDRGFLPASTFKIPNSIIGLETGVVLSDSTLFKWNGEKRRLSVWEKDMTFHEAFHASCVPCYQEVARGIGVEKMKHYLNKFGYGNMLVDSSNLDVFWLEGESKITTKEQVDFLQRFYNSNLGLSNRTDKLMKEMMIIDDNSSYRLSGKTGWSIRDGHNVGWFVGYVETNGQVYFFATNVEPDEGFNLDMFPVIRKQISLRALQKLKIVSGED